jgi:hypothetical protein
MKIFWSLGVQNDSVLKGAGYASRIMITVPDGRCNWEYVISAGEQVSLLWFEESSSIRGRGLQNTSHLCIALCYGKKSFRGKLIGI